MTTAPLAESKKPGKPANGEPCPNCGSVEPWGPASWCPACGFYPALGGTSLRSAEEVGADTGEHEAWETQDEGPANLYEAIPPWMWVAAGGALFIVLANVALRVLLPMKPSLRTLLTLLELTTGIIVAGFAQGSAYLFAACKSDKYGPFDYFMKPIEIWKPTFSKMPEGSRRVYGMAWGTTAIFAAVLVMGGFDLDSMFDDWGFEQPKPPNLVHKAVKKARKTAGEEDLEGALKEFVGEGELEEEPILLKTQCVIIGYFKNDKGELDSLVLGSAPQGRLAYVGLLSQADIPEQDRPDVLHELQNFHELPACYVKQGVPLKNAIWIEPKLLCLVEHKSWNTRYRLEQPKFMKLVFPEEEKLKREKEKAKAAKANPPAPKLD